MISVITWDAGFRESFHTVNCFRNQSMATDQYEFIWVDYYATIDSRLRQKIDLMPNGKVICLGATGKWHLGQALNHAVKVSVGDILVIPDGDIVVETDFLEYVSTAFRRQPNMALYFRRWDQPMPSGGAPDEEIDIDRLKAECTLANATNYGGCIAVRRQTFLDVGGYEEHALFAGAGAISMELYTRLKNFGAAVVWSPDMKIYHPWHFGSSPSTGSYLGKLRLQQEYIRRSDLLVHTRANGESVGPIIEGTLRTQLIGSSKLKFTARLKKLFCKSTHAES